jgi:hypothetical protein
MATAVRPKTVKQLRSKLRIDDDTAQPDYPPTIWRTTLHPASASCRRSFITRLAVLLLVVLAVALLPAQGAIATGAHAQRSACSHTSTHSAHGTIAGRCVKHATHHSKRPHVKHKHASGKKPAHKPTAPKSAALIPATCEDGTLPVHSAGSFSCRDDSEPACEDGSTPFRSSSGAALVCHVPAESSEEGEEACEKEAEGECPGGSWACEEGSEACQADSGEESSEG